ncbi:MAG: signal peptidase I, partial [Thermoplasmatota archaeon]
MNDRSLLKIGIFIVVVIILLSIVVLFFPFELNPYGRRATIVRSDSMQPVMGRGDIVLLSEKDPESIEEGDIIAVSVPEHYQENYGYPPTIIHRVMEIEEVQGQLYFNTKGDDNTQRDIFRTSSRNVIGYYTDTRIPSIGLLFMFANSIMGMLTLFSAFILIVIAVYFPWYLEKKEEEHETIERLRKGLGKIEEAIVVKWKNIKMKISDED